MSYDLFPVNKNLDPFVFGSFSWPVMLQETGSGCLIGYGETRVPGMFVYQPDKKGASPMSNDGYKITSRQAKIMAELCRGYLSVQKYLKEEWENISPEDKEREWNLKMDGKYLYKRPIREDFLKKIELFIDFAENSKGFKIK
jgi:hypothetical protein